MLAGQLVVEAYSVVLVALAADTPEAELVAAEVEWDSADPRSVVGPLTTIAEACITGTLASDRRVLRFINLPL